MPSMRRREDAARVDGGALSLGGRSSGWPRRGRKARSWRASAWEAGGSKRGKGRSGKKERSGKRKAGKRKKRKAPGAWTQRRRLAVAGAAVKWLRNDGSSSGVTCVRHAPVGLSRRYGIHCIRGARTHNLTERQPRSAPRHRLIVDHAGCPARAKSSLAFDTLYAEAAPLRANRCPPMRGNSCTADGKARRRI